MSWLVSSRLRIFLIYCVLSIYHKLWSLIFEKETVIYFIYGGYDQLFYNGNDNAIYNALIKSLNVVMYGRSGREPRLA